jgi:hypothetical protein
MPAKTRVRKKKTPTKRKKTRVRKKKTPTKRKTRVRKKKTPTKRKSRVRKKKTPKYVKFQKSEKKGKKLKAIFYNADKQKIKTTHFGATGYSDYTKHKNPKRKKSYLSRHRSREKWGRSGMMTAGALSRWILWEKTSLSAAKAAYRRRFGLKSKR